MTLTMPKVTNIILYHLTLAYMTTEPADRGGNRKDLSMSGGTYEFRESAINLDMLDEHSLLEMKVRLEDEMIKNESLEKQIRNMEFEHLKKQSELTRRV